MNPMTAIRPTRLVRRSNSKRWHLLDEQQFMESKSSKHTFCGQTIRTPIGKVAHNSAQVTCDDCLTEAISRHGR